MFGKISKAKYAKILFDAILSETDMLRAILNENEICEKKLHVDPNAFPIVSIAFHLYAYREMLAHKYEAKSVSSVITLCIEEWASRPTRLGMSERKRAFEKTYDSLCSSTEESIKDNAVRFGTGFFDSLSIQVIALLFNDKQFDSLNEDEVLSLEPLANRIADHFRNIGKNSKIMNLDAEM